MCNKKMYLPILFLSVLCRCNCYIQYSVCAHCYIIIFSGTSIYISEFTTFVTIYHRTVQLSNQALWHHLYLVIHKYNHRYDSDGYNCSCIIITVVCRHRNRSIVGKAVLYFLGQILVNAGHVWS